MLVYTKFQHGLEYHSTNAVRYFKPDSFSAFEVSSQDIWAFISHVRTSQKGRILMPIGTFARQYVQAFGKFLELGFSNCGTHPTTEKISDNLWFTKCATVEWRNCEHLNNPSDMSTVITNFN